METKNLGKIKFIEKGTMNQKEMHAIKGGACGTYSNCHQSGQRSCVDGFRAWWTVNCKPSKNW